jgi:hypothetical protein
MTECDRRGSTMRRIDRQALELAIELTMAEPDRREQVTLMLREGWEETGLFCAYHRQCRALRLRPWQEPPCWVSPNSTSQWDIEAVVLLERMLAAGVSQYHPDPLKALEEAERAAKPPDAA